MRKTFKNFGYDVSGIKYIGTKDSSDAPKDKESDLLAYILATLHDHAQERRNIDVVFKELHVGTQVRWLRVCETMTHQFLSPSLSNSLNSCRTVEKKNRFGGYSGVSG